MDIQSKNVSYTGNGKKNARRQKKNQSDAKSNYDAEFINEVNASQVYMINRSLSKSDHEQRHDEKLETVIHTSADDQIDYDIIFDDS
nr:hypothetical protein [Tanacetum cinerariifolium]